MMAFTFNDGEQVRVVVSYIAGMYGKVGRVASTAINDFGVEQVTVNFPNGERSDWATSELERYSTT